MWTFSKVLVLGVLADNMLFHILPPTASPTTDIFLSRLVSVIKKENGEQIFEKGREKEKILDETLGERGGTPDFCLLIEKSDIEKNIM